MTSTVVRVKRRLEESPLEALVVHCKRPRREDNPEMSPAVFVFSGTVNKQEKTTCHIKKAWLKKHNMEAAKDIPTLLNKIKDEHRDNTQSNRIKIVNYSRGLALSEGVEAEAEGLKPESYALLDLLHSQDSNQTNHDESQFVYDLYLSQQPDFNVDMMDDIVRIDPFNRHLMVGVRESPSSDENDSEDSNDENNWRNEYPDTDEDQDDDDMVDAMGNVRLGEYSLSSDDEEENLVYGNPNILSKFAYLDIDPEDVNRYGLSYAKYKANSFSKTRARVGPTGLTHYIAESGASDDEDCDSNTSANDSDTSNSS